MLLPSPEEVTQNQLMEKTTETTYLYIARSRLVVHLTEQIRTCVNALDDKMIWWRPNDQSNAIGNLVLHCAGSTRYYIGHVVGGSDFVRDRDAEFAERGEIPGAELLAHLDSAIAEADRVLTEFDPARLLDTTDRVPRPTTFMQVIGLQLVHYATHTGQIAFATKLLKADAIDDIWRTTRTH